MPSNHWITSTLPLLNYSVGALPIDYEMFWNPLQANDDIEIDEPFSASFNVTVNSPREQFRLLINARGKTDLKRVLGCIMVTRLPEAALDGCLIYLKDILDFHAYSMEPRTITAEPSHRTTAGHILQKDEHSELVIEE